MQRNYKKLKNGKRSYPYCAELPIKLDLDIINKYLESVKEFRPELWEDPYKSHPGLAAVNGEVAETTYKAVTHLTLTGPSKHDNATTGINYRMEDKSADELREFAQEDWKEVSVKDKLRGRADHLMNEYNWGDPEPWYEGTDLQEHLNKTFKAPIIRVRFSKMIPGGEVPPHIDYSTQYAVRFILPLSGNEGVKNVFWDKGEEHVYHLENGKPYFLNIGYKHAVYHEGNEDRVYLIGSLGGQQDIEAIRIDK